MGIWVRFFSIWKIRPKTMKLGNGAMLEQAHYLDQTSITMGPFHDYLMICLFECSIRKSQFDSSVLKLVVVAELQYRSDRLDIFTS